jgi:hypothetical protein
MTYEVNEGALNAYKQAIKNDDSSRELEYLPGSGMANLDSGVKMVEKTNKPSSDRSLRVDSWVGGHSPHGVAKPRRSWKIKGEVKKLD